MNKILGFIIFLIVVTQNSIAAPMLYFIEGYNLNVDLCAAGIQNAQPTRAAALSAIKILEKDWIENGQVLLEETEKLMKVPFSRKEITFSYHVCPTSADTWAPPSIQMGPLLEVLGNQNYSTAELRDTLVLMRDTIWHEMLHGYLHDHFFDVETPTTPLQKKYVSLPSASFVHLHLMAIQQIIYKKTDRTKDAIAVLNYYKKNLPDYFTGWTTVEVHKPSPQAFINELTDFKTN